MHPTIFVSIASYRDPRCSRTLQNLFDKAKHPERVYVGICQQNKKGDPECIDKENVPLSLKHVQTQIRVMRLNYTKARGPTYARYLCSQLYRGEDFFMQIDSHCLFAQDWDEKAIAMIESVESSKLSTKVVLSHYPPEYKDYDNHSRKRHKKKSVTHIVECYFNHDGILTFRGAVFKKPGVLPRRNAFVAGGFIFARGSLVTEVPFDPHLPYLFTGEELLLSLRFFTHGWDVYTPNANLVFHAYTRENEPKFWDDHHYTTSAVHNKVKMIAGLMEKDFSKIKDVAQDIESYGVGRVRSIEDFYAFIGVDPVTKTVGKPSIEFYCCDANNTPSPSKVVYVMVTLMVLFFLLLLVLICSMHRRLSSSPSRKN